MTNVLHETPTRYGRGMKLLFLAIMLALVIPAVFIFDSDPGGALAMLGSLLLVALVMWFIMPRKLRITEDRLQVVLGTPFIFTVPFATIKKAGKPQGLTGGINLCTSFTGVVQVARFRKANVNITPVEPEEFLDNLRQALERYKQQKEGR